MSGISTLGTILGLSFTTGINLYATVAITGMAIRFQWVIGLPKDLDILASWPIIIISIILYIIEFIADKFPGFDSLVWDPIHTFIRPLGGAFIALAAVGTSEPIIAVLAFLLGGGVSLSSHAVKASTRATINTSPEPVSNSVLSIGEDIVAIGLVYLALADPIITFIVILVLLVIIWLTLPRIVRSLRFYFSAIRASLSMGQKGVISKIGSRLFKKAANMTAKQDEIASDKLPSGHWEKLGSINEPELTSECFSWEFRGIGKKKCGFLSFTDENILFSFKKLFSVRLKKIPIVEINSVKLDVKKLYDILYIKNRKRTVSFCFLKNRLSQAKKIEKLINVKS